MVSLSHQTLLQRYIMAADIEGYCASEQSDVKLVLEQPARFVFIAEDGNDAYFVGEFFKRAKGKAGDYGAMPLAEGSLEECAQWIVDNI